MSKEFEALMGATTQIYVQDMLLKRMAAGYDFIKDEHDTAVMYHMAAKKYEAVKHLKIAAGALIAGGVAICTFAIGGWIIAGLGRAGALGVTQSGTVVGEFLTIQGGSLAIVPAQVPVWTAPLGVKLGVSAAMGTTGLVVNSLLSGGIGIGNGIPKKGDPIKVLLVIAGGAAKLGPTLALAGGSIGRALEDKARAAYLEEMSKASSQKLAKQLITTNVQQCGSKLAAFGKGAKLCFAPVGELNQKMRMPVLAEVKKLRQQVLANDNSWFSSPDKNHLDSAIRARMGAEVWAPLLIEANRAKLFLEMGLAKARADYIKSLAAFLHSVK